MNQGAAATSLHDLVPILQVAIGPVILISGIGLLLLSMTNRFGRIIDRSRELSAALHAARGAGRELVSAEIAILSKRALLVREAITLAILSVLFAAALVMTLFLAAVLKWEVGALVAALFVSCLALLVTSLVAFLRDINLSLAALRLELGGHAREPSREPSGRAE